MRVQPVGEKILVKRIAEEEKMVGGIVIPDTAKEKPQQGEVIAVGPGRVTRDGRRIPPEVKEGDKVLLGKYSGTEVTIDDEEYVFVDEEDILAILE